MRICFSKVVLGDVNLMSCKLLNLLHRYLSTTFLSYCENAERGQNISHKRAYVNGANLTSPGGGGGEANISKLDGHPPPLTSCAR